MYECVDMTLNVSPKWFSTCGCCCLPITRYGLNRFDVMVSNMEHILKTIDA